MKLAVFGGLIFVGGSIMFSASYISTEVSRSVPAGLGVLCMLFGVLLGIAGIITKNKNNKS